MVLIPNIIKLGLVNNTGYKQLWYCLLLIVYWICGFYLVALFLTQDEAYYVCKFNLLLNLTLHFLNSYDFIPDLYYFNYSNSLFVIWLDFKQYLALSLDFMNQLLTNMNLGDRSVLLDYYKMSNLPALFVSIKTMLVYLATGYPQNLHDLYTHDCHSYICNKVEEALSQMDKICLQISEKKITTGPALAKIFDEFLVNYQTIYLVLALGRASVVPEELAIIDSYVSSWYKNKIAPYGAELAIYEPLRLPPRIMRPEFPKILIPRRIETDWEQAFRHGEWVVVDENHPIPPGFRIVPGPFKGPTA